MSHSHHFASTAISSFSFMAILQRYLTMTGIFIFLVWNTMAFWRRVNPNHSSLCTRNNQHNRNQQYWNISNNGNNCNSISSGPWDAEKFPRDLLCVVGQDVVCTLSERKRLTWGCQSTDPIQTLFQHKDINAFALPDPRACLQLFRLTLFILGWTSVPIAATSKGLPDGSVCLGFVSMP